MQIVLHLGVHRTDEDNIVKCLLVNQNKLAEEGIIVPEPDRYRPIIRETLQVLKEDVPSPETQELILDAVLDEDDAMRLVLSHEAFLGIPLRALGDGKLYPKIDRRATRLRNLFANAEVEFHFAIRNPASFLPALFDRVKEPNFNTFLNGVDPMDLRWSDVISRLRQAVPDVPVTVWCNEDTPIIWHEILRRISGHDPYTHLDARDEFLVQIMGRSGVKRMQAYMEMHPPQNNLQRQRITIAFLDKFAKEEVLNQEIDLPGWDNSYVNALTEIYDADVERIAGIPGVNMIVP